MVTNWNKTALLVIDMQKGFVLPDSPWCLHGALDILPNVMKTIDVARQRGVLVIWVVREHDEYGRDIELFRRASCSDDKIREFARKGSVGAELVDGLMIEKEDYKIVKTRFSSFQSTNLHLLLQGAGITSLVVTGIQTPNCVRQTVYDAVALDYQSVTVIVDATAAASPDVQSANIYDMNNIGVAAKTSEEWCRSEG